MSNGEKRTWLKEQRRSLTARPVAHWLKANGSVASYRCGTSSWSIMNANTLDHLNASFLKVHLDVDSNAKYVKLAIGSISSNVVAAI